MNFILEYNMSNNNIKVINIKNKDAQNILNVEQMLNIKNTQINFFSNNSNKEVLISETVALEDREKIYKDDTVYIQEIENQLLSTYPVLRQNDKFIMEKVERETKSIIDTKNIGIQVHDLIKNNIDYAQKLNFINNDFTSKWVLPIVFDKHIIFSNITEESNQEMISELREDPSFVHEISQKELLQNLGELHDKFEEGKINITTFENGQAKLYQDYQIKYGVNNSIKNSGFIIKPTHIFDVLRYSDYQNQYWNTRRFMNDFTTNVDIFDEYGKIKATQSETLIKGSELNIIGFMVFREGGSKLLSDYPDIFQKENYQNHLNHVLYNKLTITEITQIKNEQIEITIENHQLHNDSIFYINGSNCYPSIDDYYGKNKKFTIISDNKIQLNIKKKLVFNGDKAELYCLNKLQFDYYNVNNQFGFDFIYSSYVSQEESAGHNKLYLFQNIENLNKQQYHNLLKKIVPSLEDVIHNEKENMEKCIHLYQIERILMKYNIVLGDLNDNQYQEIIKILQNNYQHINVSFGKTINHNKSSYFFGNKELLTNDHFYLSNKYLLNQMVENYYGKYPYNNDSFDCIMQRYNWLEDIDYGNYYGIYLSLMQRQYNLKKIQEKSKEIEDELKIIQKEFLKENQKKNNCSLFQYEATSVDKLEGKEGYLFFENELYHWDNGYQKITVNEGSYLLINNQELWQFTKNKWVKKDGLSKYKKLKYLCEFKNISFENLNLHELDCIYRKGFGCSSKVLVRFEEKKKKLHEYLDKFIKLQENVKNNKRVQFDKHKLKSLNDSKFHINQKLNKKMNKKDKNKNISMEPIDILVRSIYKLDNILLKDYYFYLLIERDGLLIGKDIYSKKYKRKYNFCGHYYYKKKEYYSSNADERQKYINILINKYSDAGESSNDMHICNHCGEVLINTDFDIVEGHAASGAYIISRDKWVAEDAFQLTTMDIDQFLERTSLFECEDDKFQEVLVKEGLRIDDIKLAKQICNFITKTLYPELDIILPNGDLIQLIIESTAQIQEIMNYETYRKKEIAKLKRKEISEATIRKYDERNIFQDNYNKFYEIKKQSIICARLLITIQVIIPNLKSTKKIVSFSEKDGIVFFAELLKRINKRLIIEKIDVLSMYEKYLQETFDKFKSFSYIREAFEEKKKYSQSLKRSFLYTKNNDENIYYIEKEPKEITENIYEKMKKASIPEFQKDYYRVKERLQWCIQEIKKLIQDVIGKKSLETLDITGGLERSCCPQEIETYIDFYQYFQMVDENTNIMKYIHEAKKLDNMLRLKIISGSFLRCVVYDKNWFVGVHNPIIVYNGKDASERFIQSIFINYVDEGVYRGTRRDFVLSMDGLKDIKSDKTIDEIKDKEYTIDDLNELLKFIELNNITTIQKENVPEINFSKEMLTKLKGESSTEIYTQQYKLLSNLSKILNKSNKIQLYQEALRNFYELNLDQKLKNKTINQKKKIINSIYVQKLDYFKKFYVKISKYLSIIHHHWEFNQDMKLFIINNKLKRGEMKKEIIESNSKLNAFIDSAILPYFKDIKLTYTLNEIQSIFKNNELDNYQAYNVIFFIVLHELNSFLSNKSNKKNTYIAQFIEVLLNEFIEDFELFDLCNQNGEFEHLDARSYNAYQIKILTSDENPIMKDYLKQRATSIGPTADDEYINIEEETKVSEERKNIEDQLTDETKDKLEKEFGQIDENTDLQTLEEIKQHLNEDQSDEEYLNLEGKPNSEDVIDQGSEYGTLNEFDFETGEGFAEEK